MDNPISIQVSVDPIQWFLFFFLYAIEGFPFLWTGLIPPGPEERRVNSLISSPSIVMQF